MNTLLAARLGVAGSIVASLLVGLIEPSTAAVAAGGRLSVSPNLYLGGQAVTFQGSLGVQGQQKIRLQSYMGRPGDEWTRVDGFHAMTAPDGSFQFSYPAPSMFGIEYRVVAAGVATPAYTFDARSQDVVLTPVPNRSGLAAGQELAGNGFTIAVDTTPVISHRPDLPGPAFPGRVLTLQRLGAQGRWTTLGTSVTDSNGEGSFDVAGTAAGCAIYRVREEDWNQGGSTIGWFPSFPTPVDVVPSVGSAGSCVKPPAAPSNTTIPPKDALNHPAATTAAGSYLWGQPLWDFAWEQGQSLTSPPSRGMNPQGWWLDRSTGLGRAAPHNGGLLLDSQRVWSGPGDFGTTSATLRGNARSYGRWEAKMRLKRLETGAGDYQARIELVPSRAKDYNCGARNITVASVPVGGSTVHIGARNGSRQWQATKKIAVPDDVAVAFAVEVTPRHITWFYNGDPIGTVRSRAAVSDVPLTMRLSLVGNGNHEMNKTFFVSDWQRGYDLHRSPTVSSGGSLRKGAFSGGC